MKIAITSCADYRANTEYPVWKKILDAQPDLLLLLGDNIYLPQSTDPTNSALLKQALVSQYDRLLADTNFKALLNFMTSGGRRIAAIYDDHDSIGEDTKHPAMNAAMRSVAMGAFFQKMPFATLGDTIYGAFEMDLARVILLDTRSYRTEDASTLNELLGDEQAAWFRDFIVTPTTKPYTLLCSGITFHRYGLLVSAGWFFHQEALREVSKLIGNKPGYAFLSGDIHDNEIKKKKGVLEIVSSGVARKGLLSNDQLGNYGILDLTANEMTVTLVGDQPKQNRQDTIRLSNWSI